MTTTTRCSSTRTLETATRPPEPRPSDSGPSISACDRSFFTVTVQVLLRVTVSSTEPCTGLQSRRSVGGALGWGVPSLIEQDRRADNSCPVVDDVLHVQQQSLLEGQVAAVHHDVLAAVVWLVPAGVAVRDPYHAEDQRPGRGGAQPARPV